MGWCPGSPSTW